MSSSLVRLVVAVVFLSPFGITIITRGADDSVTARRGNVLRLTLDQAIHMALAKNFEIQVESYSPLIARQNTRRAVGVFDPVASVGARRSESSNPGIIGGNRVTLDNDIVSGGVSGLTPWGMTYGFGLDTTAARSSEPGAVDSVASNLSANITQPLLRDFGPGPNLYRVRLARKDEQISSWQLRQQIIEIVTRICYAYNEVYYEQEDLRVARQSESLAQQLFEENRQRAEIGTMTPLDITTARAQAAQRREDVIIAAGRLRDQQVLLLQLVTNQLEGMLETEVEIAPPPSPAVSVNASSGIAEALQWRPDYRQALINLEKQHITVAFDRNQTLPRFDLIASLNALGIDRDFARSIGNALDGDQRDWTVGAAFSLPIPNRSARAGLEASKLAEAQLLVNLKRLEQEIIASVDRTTRGIDNARERIKATRESSALARESLDAGEQKLRAGSATTYEVLQLQRDFRAAELAEARARTDYNQAIAELDRQTGTAVERNRISLGP